MRGLPDRLQAALADSIIYEEHKGNFAAARLLAETALSEARASNVREVVADALLGRGVAHMLQGEPAAALDCFNEIGTVVPSDPERTVRAAAYSAYVANLQVNLFPDESGANGAEWEARSLTLLSSVGPKQEQVRELLQRVTEPTVRLEVGVVSEFLTNLLLARRVLSSHGTSSEPERQAHLATALTALESFWSQAASLHAQPQLLAYMFLASSDLHRRSGEGDRALELLDDAHKRYLDSGDLAGAATCLMARADWRAAPLSTPLLWNHAMREGAVDSELPWTVEASEFAGSNISIAGAQPNYAEADRLFREAGSARGLGALELRYGFLAALMGRYEQALDHAVEAERILEAAGDIRATWIARAHQALALVGTGRIPEHIATAEAIGSWGAQEGSFSFALGLGLLFGRAGRRWLIQEGDYERALACYRLGEAVFSQLQAPSNLAQSLVDQGTVYRVVGDHDAAMRVYERAWDLHVQAARMLPPRPSGWARTGLLVTRIHQVVVAVEDVRALGRHAKRLETLIAEWPSGGATLTQIVGANVQDLLEQARVLAPLCRATAARDEGAAAAASRHFKAALNAAQAAGPGSRDLLEAKVLATQSAYPEAIAAFQRYLDPGGASSGFMGAAVQLMALLGEEGQALARQQQQHAHVQAAAFFGRVRAYELGQEHLQVIEKDTGPEWWSSEERPWEALSICADIYEGLGRLQEARRWADRAIAALEDRRGLLSRDELKTALAGGTGPQYLYFQAARTTMKLRDAAQRAGNLRDADSYSGQAFGYAERGKARALLDLMAGGVVPRSSTETTAIGNWRRVSARLQTWLGLLAFERASRRPDPNRLKALDKHLSEDEARLRALEAQLSQSDPAFHSTINPQTPVMSLEDVRRVLPESSALLEYFFLGDDLMAWSITRGQVTAHVTPLHARSLDSDIRKFHHECQSGGAVSDVLGSRLADILLKPLSEAVRASSQLIVVPYGSAHILPFQLLPWEGRPLVATHALRNLPSASLLQFLPVSAATTADGVLAVGNPSIMSYATEVGSDPQTFPPLPAAEAEAMFVSGLFSRSKLLLDGEATDANVRAQITDYPVLHFATHACLSADAPLRSAVLLAEGAALTVYDFMGLRMDGALVVLSACETGLGDTTAGDDLLGLTRGLLAAGARAAVVSLWEVNSHSTSLLMAQFYRRLRAGDSPALALQAAQNYLRVLTPEAARQALDKLRTLHGDERTAGHSGFLEVLSGILQGPTDYRRPFYWAPFVVVG